MTAAPTPVATLLPTTATQPPDTTEPTPTPSSIDYEIVDISERVTEQNSTWWKYAWKLTMRNNGPQGLVFDAEIKFLDADGFIVDDDREYNLRINSYEEESYTGYALIDTAVARSVDSVSAETTVKQILATSSLSPSPMLPSPKPTVIQPVADVSALPSQPAVVPDGWRVQELFAAGSTFAYPSDWSIKEESTSSVTLSQGYDAINIFRISDTESSEIARELHSIKISEDSAVHAETLRVFLQATLGKTRRIQFFREGTVNAPHQPAYITAILTDENVSGAMFLTYATDMNDIYLIYLMKFSSLSFTEGDIAMLADIVRSVDF